MILWRQGFPGLVLIALLGSAVAGTLVTLGEPDNGRHIALRVGDEVRVRLPENITTGYRWTVENAGAGALELESATSEYPGKMIGAGGQALFRFRAVGAGSGEIALKYWRRWEGDASVVKRFALTVEAAP